MCPPSLCGEAFHISPLGGTPAPNHAVSCFNHLLFSFLSLFVSLVLPPVLVPTNIDHEIPSIMPPLLEDTLPENRVYPTHESLPPPIYPPGSSVIYPFTS